MNYKEYKQKMDEKGLIESFDSILHLVNAERCHQNTLNITNWDSYTREVMASNGVSIQELIHYWNVRKNAEVQLALSKAVEKESVLKHWKEHEYKVDLQELKSKLHPTIAAVTEKLEKRN